jgi:hypothetical protein
MEKAKRARKAETPKQLSLGLRLRAPYLYHRPIQPDGGEGLARRKGVAVRRGLKEAGAKTAA